MSANERDAGLLCHQMLQGVDEDLETRELRVGKMPFRMDQELFETFIFLAQGLEERRRVGNVDQVPATPLAPRLPTLAPGDHHHTGRGTRFIADVEANVLPHLETSSSAIYRTLQALGEAVRPPWLLALVPVEAAERGEATGLRPVITMEVGIQAVARITVEIKNTLYAPLVPFCHESPDVFDQPVSFVPADHQFVHVHAATK